MSASIDRAADHPMSGQLPWHGRNDLPESRPYVWRPPDAGARRQRQVRQILDDIRAQGGRERIYEPDPLDVGYEYRREQLLAEAEEPPAQEPAPVNRSGCGTTYAYRRHLRNGEQPCPACTEANRERARRAVAKPSEPVQETAPVQEPQPAEEPPRCERCGYLVTWCPCPEGPTP